MGTLRKMARWLMNGPQRRKAFDALTRLALRLLGGKIRGGPAKGLRFRGGDTAGYVLGASEPQVQMILVSHLRTGGVFYDIGANIGFLSVLGCRLVGPTGEVHCFEPLEENLRALRWNLDANGFTAVVHPLALSDSAGEASMVTDGPLGRAHFGNGTATVPTARLDDLQLRPPTVVKIDVEGAESLVLSGMRQILAEHKPVVLVEIHPGQGAPVRSLLIDAGYELDALEDGGMPHLLATPR
jgi:FkbM family methyltransferase